MRASSRGSSVTWCPRSARRCCIAPGLDVAADQWRGVGYLRRLPHPSRMIPSTLEVPSVLGTAIGLADALDTTDPVAHYPAVTMRKTNSQATGAMSNQELVEPGRRAPRPEVAPDSKSGLREVVADVREGDGVDPRDEAKLKLRERRIGNRGRERGAHRKERFLAQVEAAIDSAFRLAAEPRLNALTVREIVQQGGSLLVVAEPRDPQVPVDVLAATRALKRAATMLTREVAREITRKEAPILSFLVLPAGTERVET